MNMKLLFACLCGIVAAGYCSARTFEFKMIGSQASAKQNYWWDASKSKRMIFQIKVGSATKNDDISPIEIRAATVLRNMNNKAMGVNDIATLRFDPINTSKPLYFSIATGSVGQYWQVAGCIIEFWQNKKMVRHWSNISGSRGQQSLTSKTELLRVYQDGYSDHYREFDNATQIRATDQDGELVNLNEVLAEFRENAEATQEKSSTTVKESGARASTKKQSAPKVNDEQLQAEYDHDEDMRRKKMGLPLLERKKSSTGRGDSRTFTSSAPQVFNVEQLNSELKIKSFCGIKFGEIVPNIRPNCGIGCTLPNKFRCFNSAYRYGSEKINRVTRIKLSGSVDHLEIDAVRQEIEDVARLVGKKFGVTFPAVEMRDSHVSCSYSDDDMRINITAYVYDGTARFELSFLNKQVEQQNKQYEELLPKKRLNLSKDDGADVL